MAQSGGGSLIFLQISEKWESLYLCTNTVLFCLFWGSRELANKSMQGKNSPRFASFSNAIALRRWILLVDRTIIKSIILFLLRAASAASAASAVA